MNTVTPATPGTPGTPGTQNGGRDRRRFPRFDVEIPVYVRKKAGDVTLATADVSRHGAFIRCDTAYPVRQLVQLRFRLPDRVDVDAMCMVARWLPDSPRGSGIGVDFFALSKEAKAIWERFVSDLRARDAAIGFDVAHTPTGTMALPPNAGLPLPAIAAAPISFGIESARPSSISPLAQSLPPTGAVPDWLSPNSLTNRAPVGSIPPLPGTSSIPGTPSSTPTAVLPPPPPPDDDAEVDAGALLEAETSVVILRMPDRDALKSFIDNEIARGGMFLKTLLVKEVGEKVAVVLVHPETDEEFHLDGTVVRRIINGAAEQRGLGIFFRSLSAESHQKLEGFAESGIEVIELGVPISQRQVELETAVAREPDSAEALEALGAFLLDEEGDLGGALTALTRALVLGPSQVSIHASLARAYRRVGDQVKVRAHERVAEALMMFQEKLKVRLGV